MSSSARRIAIEIEPDPACCGGTLESLLHT
jgi:hypothetical protein